MSNYKINNLQKYNDAYKSSINDPEKFWEDIAEKNFIWKKKWDSVLEWDFSKPEIKWFKYYRKLYRQTFKSSWG